MALRASALALLSVLAFAAPASAAPKKLPKGFLWGVATAGFQGDMGPRAPNDPNSDWWAWVRDPDNISKKRVSGDLPENGPAQWTHYKQDVALARKKLNANAFRFSIEWSRIFPNTTEGATTKGELDAIADQSALRHYRAELSAIRKAGMTPFVTLQHFTLPIWLHDPIAARNAFAAIGPDDPPPAGAGGWLDPRTEREFAKYARYVAGKLGDLVDYWAPINEPNVVAVQGYLNVEGVFASWYPPGAFNYSAVVEALMAQARGNAGAYDAIRAADPTSRVGLVEHIIAFRAARGGQRSDRRGAAHADYLFNRTFLDAAIKGDYDANANGVIDAGEGHPELAHKADFVGINYYRPGLVTGLPQPLSKNIPLYDFIPKVEFARSECPHGCSDLGWRIEPAALRGIIPVIAQRYRLPLYITENGIADARDSRRAAYIRAHIRAVREAVRAGSDVRGYFYWSLEDNLEWADGYAPKFGLFTKARRMRASANVFRAETLRR
ncbi:MAG: family 1 glycosylhydrolase [Thermoleophilaceae bacterium]